MPLSLSAANWLVWGGGITYCDASYLEDTLLCAHGDFRGTEAFAFT